MTTPAFSGLLAGDIHHPFEFPFPVEGGKILSGDAITSASLTGGQTQVVFSKAAGTRGIIRNLSFVIDAADMEVMLRVKVDGESIPSIYIPLPTSVGLEYPDSSFADMEIHTPCFELTSGPKIAGEEGYAQGFSGNIRLPMPFSDGIEIALVNTGSTAHDTYVNVIWQDTLPGSWNSNLRLKATRSSETLSGAAAAGNLKLTDATHVQAHSGSVAAGVVAGTVLIADMVNQNNDMLVLQRVDSTHLVVSAKDTATATLNVSQAMLYSPCHAFLTRSSGEKGWLAAVVGACSVPAGGSDISQQFEPTPRVFLNGESEASLIWTSTEDFANGSYYFAQPSRGEEGGVSAYGPVLPTSIKEFCVYKSFYKWPIRYTNGVKATVPVFQAYATTFNWTTYYYVEVAS